MDHLVGLGLVDATIALALGRLGGGEVGGDLAGRPGVGQAHAQDRDAQREPVGGGLKSSLDLLGDGLAVRAASTASTPRRASAREMLASAVAPAAARAARHAGRNRPGRPRGTGRSPGCAGGSGRRSGTRRRPAPVGARRTGQADRQPPHLVGADAVQPVDPQRDIASASPGPMAGSTVVPGGGPRRPRRARPCTNRPRRSTPRRVPARSRRVPGVVFMGVAPHSGPPRCRRTGRSSARRSDPAVGRSTAP